MAIVVDLSERESEPSHERPRLQEMRSTKRGKEVVERDPVRKVRDLKRCCDSFALFPVQQIIRTDPKIQDVPRLHTIGVVIVVLLSGLRKCQELRRDRPVAGGDWRRKG